MKLRDLCIITVLFLFALTAASAAGQNVSFLVTEKEERIYATDGGDELVKCFSKSADISIDGNPAAADRINAFLDNMELTMMNQCRGSVGEQKNVLAEIAERGEDWRPMFTLETRSDVTVQRAAGNVISFQVVDYMYTGGAHGMYGVTGLTFDTLTGKLLSLEEISGQPAALRETCIDEMIRQCLAMEHLWWDNESDLRPAIEQIADRDSWYLTESGIVFHSDPYELAPYSEGAIEFLIPYSMVPERRY